MQILFLPKQFAINTKKYTHIDFRVAQVNY